MAAILSSLIKWVPGKRTRAGGTGISPTYNPAAPTMRQAGYATQEHLLDLSDQSRSLTQNSVLELFQRADPDVSAAFHAFLTVSDVEPQVSVRDFTGAFNEEAAAVWPQLVAVLTHQFDMSLGFVRRPSLRSLCEALRHMCLLRGACAAELVVDKQMLLNEMRIVDPATLKWTEAKPGLPKPEQIPKGSAQYISLDLPTFFISQYRGSPLSNYSISPFASAINTIAARTQVINDLYRIMKLTGYPRIDVKVLEASLMNAAPANVKTDQVKAREWVNARISDINSTLSGMAPDQAFVHTDSTEVSMVNEKAPGSTLNADAVIKVLNAQNQAGLKVVGTVLGRGESGVNTASVEARIFSLTADSVNAPVAELLSNFFSCAFQLSGYPVYVEVKFPPSEMRPITELEPQLMIRQTRLLNDLSWGIITDDEYHMTMYGRLPPAGSPTLSGTRFLPTTQNKIDPTSVSPNSDPMGRSLSPEGSSNSRSNTVGGPGSAQSKAKTK